MFGCSPPCGRPACPRAFLHLPVEHTRPRCHGWNVKVGGARAHVLVKKRKTRSMHKSKGYTARGGGIKSENKRNKGGGKATDAKTARRLAAHNPNVLAEQQQPSTRAEQTIETSVQCRGSRASRRGGPYCTTGPSATPQAPRDRYTRRACRDTVTDGCTCARHQDRHAHPRVMNPPPPPHLSPYRKHGGHSRPPQPPPAREGLAVAQPSSSIVESSRARTKRARSALVEPPPLGGAPPPTAGGGATRARPPSLQTGTAGGGMASPSGARPR